MAMGDSRTSVTWFHTYVVGIEELATRTRREEQREKKGRQGIQKRKGKS